MQSRNIFSRSQMPSITPRSWERSGGSVGWRNRSREPGMLEEVAKHGLSYPVTHGARVTLTVTDEPDF